MPPVIQPTTRGPILCRTTLLILDEKPYERWRTAFFILMAMVFFTAAFLVGYSAGLKKRPLSYPVDVPSLSLTYRVVTV